jgi:hypothetical protein
MIQVFTVMVKKIKGSSLILPAHWDGGARASINFVAAEKSFYRSEDGSAGGGWGEECRAVRAKSEKPRRLLVQSRTPQKSFVFLLEEKIGRAQIRKCEQNFSVVWRALASGGGAERQFRSKKVRAFSNKGQYII